jgi:uncharacterized membrane protein YoaK (UPF0700 family)
LIEDTMSATPAVEKESRFWMDDRYGPIPSLLLVLTLVTGLVDAVSYFKLGHVFVANMTGNVVFLGFAVADAKDFSIPASVVALASFLCGALLGGRIGAHIGQHRGRLLATATYIETVLIGAALVLLLLAPEAYADVVQYGLIILLALAMGLQNANARRLGIPDLTTTVLTLTLAALAADSSLAGGLNPNPRRRLLAVACMFLGAAVGAWLIFHVGVAAVLILVFVLLLANAIAGHGLSSSTEAWTK